MREDQQELHQNYLRLGKKEASKTFRRQRFCSYILHLSGNRKLLRLLIQHPILNQCRGPSGTSDKMTSASNAEQLAQFMKEIDKLRKGQNNSDEDTQLTKEIAQQEKNLEVARGLARRILDPWNALKVRFLRPENRRLFHDLSSGKLESDLRRLRQKQTESNRAAPGKTDHHGKHGKRSQPIQLRTKRQRNTY